jgi:HEAT repeat protein
VLILGAALCVAGCTGNSPTSDKAKQDGKDTGQAKKENEPEDKVKVFGEVASNPKVAFRDRKEAVELLGNMGPKAKNAVPNLVKAFEDETLVESGPGASSNSGEDLLGRSELTSKLRVSIARTLGQIGPDAKEAVPALTKRLQSWKSSGGSDAQAAELGDRLLWGMSGRGKVYLATAEALWKIEKKAESVVPTLTLSAKYGDDQEQVTSLKLLGEIGPEAKSAVPVISSCRSSASADVRFAAEEALKKIDPSATSKDK